MRRKTREIPQKNYITYGLIVFFTLAASISMFVIYENHKNYLSNIPVLRGIAREIESKDLNEYLKENEDVILYFGVANDENSREVEEDLKDLINRKNLDIVYVNLGNVEKINDFYKTFNSNYSNGTVELSNYPAFVLVHDQKIVDLVQRNERKLFIGDIEQLVDVYEIRGEEND